jgi:hypothetical protein
MSLESAIKQLDKKMIIEHHDPNENRINEFLCKVMSEQKKDLDNRMLKYGMLSLKLSEEEKTLEKNSSSNSDKVVQTASKTEEKSSETA